MVINLKTLCLFSTILFISHASAMQNPVGTLDTQTRTRFAALTPTLYVEPFWSRLHQADQLAFKEKRSMPGQTGRSMLSDEEFKQKAIDLYLQVMPFSYRIYYYAQNAPAYAKQLATNTRYRISAYFAPELEHAGKVAVATPKRPPMRVTEVEEIPVLSKLTYKHKIRPQIATTEAVAVSESEEASPFEPKTPRQFIASIESVHIPQLHHQQRIKLQSIEKQIVEVPTNILYLLPTLWDQFNEYRDFDNPTKIPIDAIALSSIITLAWRIRELFNVMMYHTKQKYNVSKTYAPDDIPLTIRMMVVKLVDSTSGKVKQSDYSYLANMIEAANWMQAPWLLKALSAEWASRNRQASPEEQNLISQDVRDTYIKKYRTYLDEDTIYNEFSVADFALLRKPNKRLPYFLTNDRDYSLDIIQKMETRAFSWSPFATVRVQAALLTSLTGFEFLDTQELEKIKNWDVFLPSMQDTHYFALRPLITGIQILKSYTFLGCSNLEHINLATTGIKKVAPNAFAGPTKLKTIMLNNTGGDDILLKYYFNLINKISPEECARIKKEVGQNVQLLCPRPIEGTD
jgi:hypothetical protein